MMYKVDVSELVAFQKENSNVKAFTIGHDQKSPLKFDWAVSKAPFVIIPSSSQNIFNLMEGINYLIVMRNKILVVVWNEDDLVAVETDKKGNLVSYVSSQEKGLIFEPYNEKGIMVNFLENSIG